jgi:hypothetical protein
VHADPDRVDDTASCSSRNADVDSNVGADENIIGYYEMSLNRQMNGGGQSANGHEMIKLTPNKLARRTGKRKPFSDRSFWPEKTPRLFSLSDPEDPSPTKSPQHSC